MQGIFYLFKAGGEILGIDAAAVQQASWYAPDERPAFPVVDLSAQAGAGEAPRLMVVCPSGTPQAGFLVDALLGSIGVPQAELETLVTEESAMGWPLLGTMATDTYPHIQLLDLPALLSRMEGIR